jgi:hypothetical protein
VWYFYSYSCTFYQNQSTRWITICILCHLHYSMMFLQLQLYTVPESLCKMDYSLYHLSSTLDDCVIFLQLQLRILPESVHKMCYNLYPLLSGLVALPRLRLTISDQSNMPIRQPELTELLERSLPSHVFVMVSISVVLVTSFILTVSFLIQGIEGMMVLYYVDIVHFIMYTGKQIYICRCTLTF